MTISEGRPIASDAAKEGSMDKKVQYNLWYVLAAVFGVLLLQALWQQSRQVEPIPYSQFQSYLRDGKIDDIVITDKYIQGKLRMRSRTSHRNSSRRALTPTSRPIWKSTESSFAVPRKAASALSCAISCPGSCRS